MLHEGHRSRMIEKLKKSAELPEHELLEILLFNAIPRKNTNEIAHNLLDRFRSIRGVFTASVEELCSIDGVGESTAAYLRIVGLFFDKYQPQSDPAEVFNRSGDFSKYLISRYQNITKEILDIYFLDKNDVILSVKSFGSYRDDRVDIDPKAFAKAVADSNAKGIVIAHNHPGKSSSPSTEDDTFTKQCQILCSMTNVTLVDHFVIGENGAYSYFNSGRLGKISKKYSIGSILNED